MPLISDIWAYANDLGNKRKQFRWTAKMAEKDLVEYLHQYNTEMTYKHLDSNSDKPLQYSELQK